MLEDLQRIRLGSQRGLRNVEACFRRSLAHSPQLEWTVNFNEWDELQYGRRLRAREHLDGIVVEVVKYRMRYTIRNQ